MAKPISTSVPRWKVEKIMQYWRTHKDNRSRVIAERFKMAKITVDQIISRELSKKLKSKQLRK